MRQWQAYLRTNVSREHPRGYQHALGYFVIGSDEEPPLVNVTARDCLAECTSRGSACVGICFEDDEPMPSAPLAKCYVKGKGARYAAMDLSNSHHCNGTASPSDCPYNFYRTSGDIQPHWRNVLLNLASTLRFLDGAEPLSRPGAFAYPDMLEVGNLANATESRSHFSLWAVMSSPLILSFRLTDAARMDEAWPIITNRRVLAVNQAWAGHPGRRLAAADTPAGANPPPSTPIAAVGWEWQIWAKPLGRRSHAVLFVSTGSSASTALALPFANVSADFASWTVAACVFDLYDAAAPAVGPVDPRASPLRSPALDAHDAHFVCVSAIDAAPGASCDAPASRGGCPA